MLDSALVESSQSPQVWGSLYLLLGVEVSSFKLWFHMLLLFLLPSMHTEVEELGNKYGLVQEIYKNTHLIFMTWGYLLDDSPGFANVITSWIYEDSWKTKTFLTNTGSEPHCLLVCTYTLCFSNLCEVGSILLFLVVSQKSKTKINIWRLTPVTVFPFD